MQHVFGGPAQDELAHPRSAVGAHDQQVGRSLVEIVGKDLSDLATGRIELVNDSVDAMNPQVANHVITKSRAGVGFFVDHGKHANLLGHGDDRQRVSQRARGGSATGAASSSMLAGRKRRPRRTTRRHTSILERPRA